MNRLINILLFCFALDAVSATSVQNTQLLGQSNDVAIGLTLTNTTTNVGNISGGTNSPVTLNVSGTATFGSAPTFTNGLNSVGAINADSGTITNTFVATNANNTLGGDGGAITGIGAPNISSGKLAAARLPNSAMLTNNSTAVSLTNGANLLAASLFTGTINSQTNKGPLNYVAAPISLNSYYTNNTLGRGILELNLAGTVYYTNLTSGAKSWITNVAGASSHNLFVLSTNDSVMFSNVLNGLLIFNQFIKI